MGDLPPPVTLHGVKMVHFKADRVDATGRAERLTYERGSTDFVGYRAELRFPRPDSSAHVDVSAPELRGALNSKHVEGTGGVGLRSSAGLVASTERAHFDGASMTAAGNAPVQLHGPRYRLEASDFAYRFEDEAFTFHDATAWLAEGR